MMRSATIRAVSYTHLDVYKRQGWNTSSTGAPLVAGRLVIVGSSGADMGSRGVVSAYDAASGALVWRFWVVPGDPAAGPDESPDVTRTRATWPKDTLWQLGMGGNVWDLSLIHI